MAVESTSKAGYSGGVAPHVPPNVRQLARPEHDAKRLETPVVEASALTQPTKTELVEAVAKVQKVVESQASNLLFTVDDASGRTVVRVVDSLTKETIRQIPSEEVLSIAKALDKLQGLLIKQTA